MDVQPQAAPGWYPDTDVTGWVRWWDGRQWTEHRGPPSHVQRVYEAPPAVPADPFDRPYGQAKVTFGEAVSLAFRQYARFSGRASRSEFWWWYLFGLLTGFIAYLPEIVASGNRSMELEQLCAAGRSSACTESPTTLWILVPFLWLLVLLLPTIAVSVRRLHDSGKSGAWYLLAVVPCGSIALLVLLALGSDPGPNAYGMPPTKGRVSLAGIDATRPHQLG